MGPPWGPAGPPGVLLGRSWRAPGALLTLGGSSRHRGHSRGRFSQSPGALLKLFGAPGPHSRVFFLSGKAFCFGVLRHRTRSRNRLLVFSFGSFKSRVLGFSSGVLGFSSGVFGFSSGLMGFSSGVLACDSGVFSSALLGFSREVLAFRSWGFNFSSAPPQPKPQPPLGL